MIRYFIIFVIFLVFSCDKGYSECDEISANDKVERNVYQEKNIVKNDKNSQGKMKIPLKDCRSSKKIDLKERPENKILNKSYARWKKDTKVLKSEAPKVESQLTSDTRKVHEEIRDFPTQERMAQSMTSNFVMQQREKVKAKKTEQINKRR